MSDINLQWVFWWHPEGHQWRDTTPESLYHRVRPDDPERTACGRPIGSSHRAYTDSVEGRDPATVCRSCARSRTA